MCVQITWDDHKSDERDCGDIQLWYKVNTFHKPRHKIYIDSSHKKPERRAAYPEQITVHFENIDNITIDSASVIPKEKKIGVRKIIRYLLTTKMRQVMVLSNTQVKQLNKKNEQDNWKKTSAKKSKSQKIRLHIFLISNLTLTIYQHHHWPGIWWRVRDNHIRYPCWLK